MLKAILIIRAWLIKNDFLYKSKWKKFDFDWSEHEKEGSCSDLLTIFVCLRVHSEWMFPYETPVATEW